MFFLEKRREREIKKIAKTNTLVLDLMEALSLANEKHDRDSNVIELQNKLIKNIEKVRDEQRDVIYKLQKELEKYKKKCKELKEEKILRKTR